MANNNILFDAAFSAASAFLKDATYVNAFANAVDGGIAVGNYNAQDAMLLLATCTGALSNRTVSTSAVVATIAAAAVAEFAAKQASLLIAPSSLNIQTFLGAGAYTWTKPNNAKLVDIYVWPVGGPGGSGRNNGAVGVTNAGGGGAGASGTPKILHRVDAAILAATVAITIGALGTPGPAQTNPAGANGTAGIAGTATSFGTLLVAAASNPGLAGTTSGGGAGSITGGFQDYSNLSSANSGAGSTSNNGSVGSPTATVLCSGAGGGGAVPIAGTSFNGGDSGTTAFATTAALGGIAPGNNGANGANGASPNIGSQGGAGGASNGTGGNAGAGGTGGFPSGGGGGGGASAGGGNSGPGGQAGGALIVVITECD